MAGVQQIDGADGGRENQMGPALNRHEQLVRLLLEQMPAVLWSVDRDLRFTASLGAGLVALGLRPGQVVGMPLTEYLGRSEPGYPPLAAHLEALQGQVSDYDVGVNGRSFRSHVEPLRDDAGQIIGAVGVAIDVTESRHAEQALREREEELRQAQRLEAVGRLAGGVAHDFNNLLQTILGYAHRVLWALDESDAKRSELEQILQAAERATSLTNQLLAFSRRQVLKPEILDLGQLVVRQEPVLRRLCGPKVELEVRGGSGYVHADPRQLEQVLTNLALFAADAMPDGGRLTVETRRVTWTGASGMDIGPGPFVLLTVRDTGVGLDEYARSKIFEPVFGGRTPALGLASVYGIVKQSHGHILVDSQPGHGAVFSVYLPAADPDQKRIPSSPSAPELAGDETILLVDDEPGVRLFVRRSLEDYGYRVLEAGGLDEALSLGQSYPGLIHLLLTDVVLPGTNGPQLAARLAPLRPEMRILYMTGHADDAIVHRGVLSAGQALLVKPFTPLGLAHEVKKILRN